MFAAGAVVLIFVSLPFRLGHQATCRESFLFQVSCRLTVGRSSKAGIVVILVLFYPANRFTKLTLVPRIVSCFRTQATGSLLRLRSPLTISFKAKRTLDIIDLFLGEAFVIVARFGFLVGAIVSSAIVSSATSFLACSKLILLIILPLCLIELSLPLRIGNRITILTITNLVSIQISAVVGFGLISGIIGQSVQLSVVVGDLITVSTIVLVLSVSIQTILVVQVFALSVVLVEGQLIQFRHDIIELLQVALVGLLANGLCIGVAVSAGHSLGLSHCIHHGHLALGSEQVLILLIQCIAVQIVGELLPVQDLV